MAEKKPEQTKQSKVNDYHYYLGSTGASHRVKTGNISQLLVKSLFGLFVILFLFSLVGAYHTVRLTYFNTLVALEEIKEKKLLTRIQQAEELVKNLQEEYEQVYRIEDNLRLVHGLAPLHKDLRMAGVGGQPVLPFFSHKLRPTVSLQRISALNDSLEHMAYRIASLNTTKLEVYKRAERNTRYHAQFPSIWPNRGSLSSSFGSRFHPILGRRQMHNGLDISNRTGSKIIAPADGIVNFEGWDGAYGIMVKLRHPQTGYETRYAHMSRTAVESGQRVQRGDVLGYVGNTGRSSGPHLHYEVRRYNTLINPMNVMPHPTLVVE